MQILVDLGNNVLYGEMLTKINVSGYNFYVPIFSATTASKCTKSTLEYTHNDIIIMLVLQISVCYKLANLAQKYCYKRKN